MSDSVIIYLDKDFGIVDKTQATMAILIKDDEKHWMRLQAAKRAEDQNLEWLGPETGGNL